MGWLQGLLGFLGLAQANQASQDAANAAKAQQEQQAQANNASLQMVNLQKEALQPQLSLFQNYGLPGYLSALKGLMASYGFQPKYSAKASTSPTGTGSTVGQRPVTGEARVSNNPWAGTTKAQESVGIAPNAAGGSSGTAADLPGSMFEGTWGYSGQQGMLAGQIADKYSQAKRLLSARAKTEGLPPATVAAALTHLDQAQAEELATLSIQMQQAGPQALLSAIAPALGEGQIVGQQAGQTGTALTNIAANLASQGTQNALGQQQLSLSDLAQLGQAIALLSGAKKQPTYAAASPAAVLSPVLTSAPIGSNAFFANQPLTGYAAPIGTSAFFSAPAQ